MATKIDDFIARPLPEQLLQWSQKLGYVPRDSDPLRKFERICSGPMQEKWAYLVRHVRSKEEARMIRGNLKLAHRRFGNQGNQTTMNLTASLNLDDHFIGADSVFSEKDALIQDYKSIEKDLKKHSRRLSTVEASSMQYIKDVNEQEAQIGELKAKIDQARKTTHLLGKFTQKTKQEILELEKIASHLKQIRQGSSGLFRFNKKERLIANSNSGRLETAAEHAVTESTRCAHKILDMIFNSSGEEDALIRDFHDLERICSHLFADVSAPEIVSAIIQFASTGRKNEIHQQHLMNDTFRPELKCSESYRTSFNPEGRFISLEDALSGFASEHVKVTRDVKRIFHELEAMEQQVMEKSKRLRQMIMTVSFQNTKSEDENQASLIARKFLLESLVAGCSSRLSSLTSLVATAEKEIRHKMDSLEHDVRRLERRKDEMNQNVDDKSHKLQSLIQENNSFYTVRLPMLLDSIKDLVVEEIVPFGEAFSTSLTTDLLDKPLKLARALKEVSNIGAFETTKIVKTDGKTGRCQTSSLPLHRLVQMSGEDYEVHFAVKCMEMFLSSSVASVISQLVKIKEKRLRESRWLKGFESSNISKPSEEIADDDVKNTDLLQLTRKNMKNLLHKLQAFESHQHDTLMPQLVENLKAVKKRREEQAKRFETALQVWKDEPGQRAIQNDESIAVSGMTLKKWQDKFRVALTKWLKETGQQSKIISK